MRSRYLSLRLLGIETEATKLGEMNEEELNRLDEKLREISYTLKNKVELSQRKQERAEQEVKLALRGASGGVKVLGGTALVAGSIGVVVAVVASEGTLLPMVVLTGASAGVMFGTSDVIEGVGDLTAAITGQGLDQRSYNPVRDTLFGGNELIYAGTEILASAGTSVAASKALASTSSATTESLQATSGRELAIEAEATSSGATVQNK